MRQINMIIKNGIACTSICPKCSQDIKVKHEDIKESFTSVKCNCGCEIVLKLEGSVIKIFK